MKRKIIIKQPWGGLGDNLAYSTLPEIAYKTYGEKCVFIHNNNAYRNSEIKKLVWELNPYIAGFTSDIDGEFVSANGGIMQAEKRCGFTPENKHPKIYYTFNESKTDFFRDKVFIDITFSAFNRHAKSQSVTNAIVSFFKNFKTEKQIYLIKFNKNLSRKLSHANDYIKLINYKEYIVENIFDYCDLIKYCHSLICSFSGQSVLAAAIKGNDKTPNIISFPSWRSFSNKSYVFDNCEYILQ